MATRMPDGTLMENWTTHDVNYIDMENNVKLCIPAEAEGPARIDMDSVPFNGSKCLRLTTFGDPKRLPSPKMQDGKRVYYIVSAIVKSANPGRPDLVVPSGVIRNQNGQVYGCGHFSI